MADPDFAVNRPGLTCKKLYMMTCSSLAYSSILTTVASIPQLGFLFAPAIVVSRHTAAVNDMVGTKTTHHGFM